MDRMAEDVQEDLERRFNALRESRALHRVVQVLGKRAQEAL